MNWLISSDPIPPSIHRSILDIDTDTLSTTSYSFFYWFRNVDNSNWISIVSSLSLRVPLPDRNATFTMVEPSTDNDKLSSISINFYCWVDTLIDY